MAHAEFSSAADLVAHYAAVKKRLRAWEAPPERRPALLTRPVDEALRGDCPPAPAPRVLTRAERAAGLRVEAECRASWLLAALLAKDADPAPAREHPSLSAILVAVCDDYGFSPDEIRSDRRLGYLMEPRHVAIFLSHRLTVFSYPRIGRFYNRDHTSVIHATKRIARLVKDDVDLSARVARLALAAEGAS